MISGRIPDILTIIRLDAGDTKGRISFPSLILAKKSRAEIIVQKFITISFVRFIP